MRYLYQGVYLRVGVIGPIEALLITHNNILVQLDSSSGGTLI